jgi:anti-sigma B factor antagonist
VQEGTSAEGTVVLVVSIAEIDQATAGRFEAEITTAITPPPSRLEIDMAAVTFLDSSGIRVLVHTYQAMTEAGATMSLRNVSGIVRRVIEAVGLDGVIDIV